MSTFPSILTTYTDPIANQHLNSPSHSSIEAAQNSGLTQLEAVIGTTSSALGTIQYDLRAAASNGGGHVQTANKGGTGQTSFIKGDILVAQSASVLSKLAIGTAGQALIVDANQSLGVKWGTGNVKPNVTVYSVASTLTWNKPSTLSYAIVELVGGGGGGGGQNAQQMGQGGGGGGGYSLKVISASTLGTTETVIIGAAGAGVDNGSGTNGGQSSFGTTSYMSGGGGKGAVKEATNLFAAGGAGGAGAGGDINFPGETGSYGGVLGAAGIGGKGGSSRFGFGGPQLVQSGATAQEGISSSIYGSGGGGCAAGTTVASKPGGNGSNGIVIVYEY